MNAASTIAALALTYALFFAIERARPLRRAKAGLLPRLGVNAVLSAIAFATAAVLVRPAALAAGENGFGLLRAAGLDGVAEVVAAFLLLDLTFYYWHVANHRLAFLWRMHNVHHIDPGTWWDRLHGTSRLDVPQDRINIGIPAYSRLADNRLLSCMAMPFAPQRDYWQGHDASRAHREPAP